MANGILFLWQHLAMHSFPTPCFQLTFSSPTIIIDLGRSEKRERKSISSALTRVHSLKNFLCLSLMSCVIVFPLNLPLIILSLDVSISPKEWETKGEEKSIENFAAAVALMRFHRRVPSNFFFSLRVDYLLAMCESH